MEDLRHQACNIDEVRNIAAVFQQEDLRDWLRSHSSEGVSQKYEQRHEDSVLLQKLKQGLRAERRQRQELENSLLYAGVDTNHCHEIIDCGDSLSECLAAVQTVSFKNEDELRRLRESISYIDRRSHSQLVAGINPLTVITEFRRQLVLHALMGSEDFHVNREHCAGILDVHVSRDPRPKKKVNLKKKPNKHNFLTDSLDSLMAGNNSAMLSQKCSSKMLSSKLHSSKFQSSKLASGNTSPSSIPSGRISPMSPEERISNIASVLVEAENAHIEEDTLDEFEYSGSVEEDEEIERSVKMEKSRMLKLTQTAFRTSQAFKPEWKAYDAMKERWKSGSIRPTLSQLDSKI